MRIIKKITLFLFLLIEITLLISLPAKASEGADAFQQNCSRCHNTADSFTTAHENIAAVLTSGSVRKHRFTLEDKTIQLIVSYIKQQQK